MGEPMQECPCEPSFSIVKKGDFYFRQYTGVEVEAVADKDLTTTFSVSESDFHAMAGPKRSNLAAIGQSTGTRITARKEGEKFTITITASSENPMAAAQSALEKKLEDARENCLFTHFVAIPTVDSPDHVASINAYLESVKPHVKLAPNAHQNTHKLHFSLILLKLLSDTELDIAKNVFASICDSYLFNCDMLIEYSGLSNFPPRRKSNIPSVFFASPRMNDLAGRIIEFQQILAARFQENGLNVVTVVDHLHETVLKANWLPPRISDSTVMNMLQIGAEFAVAPIALERAVIYSRETDPKTGNYTTVISCPLK